MSKQSIKRIHHRVVPHAILRACLCTRVLFALLLLALLPNAKSIPPIPSFHLVPSKVPPGSFLIVPVESTRQLVLEVRNHPLVAQRYLHHYRLNSLGELELALAQLHLKRLAAPHVLPVWYVHSLRGRDVMGYRLRKLPAGTPVFVDEKGTPVLIAVCGNPIGNIQLPPPRSVAQNLFNVAAPNLNLAFTPSNIATPELTPVAPAQTKNVEIAAAPALAPLVPPGLPEAHVTGGFPYGALGLPFLFHGASHGGPPPGLAALPPQLLASGAQTAHGLVPEGGLGSLLAGLVLPCLSAIAQSRWKARKKLYGLPAKLGVALSKKAC